MVNSNETTDNDSGFVGIVETALTTALHLTQPEEVYLVAVDGWFDYKWQEFAGTLMHDISIWRHEKLRVPPFNPTRVLSERYFRVAPDLTLEEATSRKPLHIHQPSADNLSRTVRNVSSSGLFVWYSQVSEDADRASLMLYATEFSEATGWYAGFTKRDDWRLAQVKGISRRALAELLLSRDPASNKALQLTAR
jgi:hypothetical protein